MSDSNNNSKLLIIMLLLALVAGAAYYVLSGKTEQAETTATTTSEDQSATTPTDGADATNETTATEEKPPVVVQTKTLNLPAAAPTIPSSEVSKDPAVEAMMAVRKLGSDDAPIKVVEYSSLTCGHCSAFHKNDFPKIKTEYIDTGKVQFIFKEFPLNQPAIDASKLLRCMPEDKFVAFQSLLFEDQEKWAYAPDYLSPLKQNAKLAGLSDDQVKSCLDNKALEARIIGDMKAASDAYKIQSTPTFIVNDGVKTIVGHQPVTFFEETFNGLLGTAPTSEPAKTEEPKKE